MTIEQDNRNRLDQELGILGQVLREVLLKTPGFEAVNSRDSSASLAVILQNWDATFGDDMARCDVRYAHLDRVRHIQNDLAYHEEKYRDVEWPATAPMRPSKGAKQRR